MNRVLNRIFDQLTEAGTAADRELLDRYLTARDESAFAELVRRYGPVVWGACRRRLDSVQDAEDAFQAAFLVLLRRAARLRADTPLGPWLYQVAVMTARNVTRANRRRAAVTGPMEHEVPSPGPDPSADALDLDAALLALPERDRVPVVLCHLQGLTRREAAERLGCPEGTLSARLNRALAKLRARLGSGAAAALAAGAAAVPAQLATATVRAATIYTTSVRTAAGVCPAVVGLTDGVLHMFWVKKLTTAAVLAVLALGTGAAMLGTVGRSESGVRADEPTAAAAPTAAPDEADALKRLERQLAVYQQQKALAEAAIEHLNAEKRSIEEARKAKAAALELGSNLEIVVEHANGVPYTVREVVKEKIGEVRCSDPDVLAKYLGRAFDDPRGPKNLRVLADKGVPDDRLKTVFEACAAAGYNKASLVLTVTEAVALNGPGTYGVWNPTNAWSWGTINQLPVNPYTSTATVPNLTGRQRTETRDIDLTKYAAPQKP